VAALTADPTVPIATDTIARPVAREAETGPGTAASPAIARSSRDRAGVGAAAHSSSSLL
jgi:hypothetical protein